ncbi:hypothetical protein Tco_0205375 [Tanacetum coccineum]
MGKGESDVHDAFFLSWRCRGTLEEEMVGEFKCHCSMEDEEVPLVDGVFEGALGALEALVDAMEVYDG